MLTFVSRGASKEALAEGFSFLTDYHGSEVSKLSVSSEPDLPFFSLSDLSYNNQH
jgi:hypothetical protein